MRGGQKFKKIRQAHTERSFLPIVSNAEDVFKPLCFNIKLNEVSIYLERNLIEATQMFWYLI